MKKIFLYLEFLLISILFIIPPLLIKSTEINQFTYVLSWYSLITFALSVFLFYQAEFYKGEFSNLKFFDILLYVGRILFYFGILVVLYITIAIVIFVFPSLAKSQPQMDLPSNAINLALLYVEFLVAAFFEECLYRLYLPKFFYYLSDKKSVRIIAEILIIAVFAFSHRYLGAVGVINAAISGIVLRMEAVKTKTIITSTITHFLYNSLVLTLLILA